MRVDVITRHAVRNFGSLLQAIATNEILRPWSPEVRFVDYRQPGYDDTGWSYANRGSAREWPVLAKAAYAALRDPGVRKIGRAFEGELRSRLQLTDGLYRSIGSLVASSEFEDTSYLCVGSDQVWNVDYNVDNRPYYLDFGPSTARRFSFASSLGMGRLPTDEEARLVGALKGFSGVSVRERDCADYLNDLGIEAEQHVDPTLGVSPSFWRSFAKMPETSEPYLLVYQLNGAQSFNPIVNAIASTLGIPVKRVEYWRGPRSLRVASAVLPSIREFVGLFEAATFVVTDSFHGTAFSTIFNRPFVAVAPPMYSGRIKSILSLTGQEERFVANPLEGVEVALERSDAESDLVLARERASIDGYLGRVFRN